MNENAVPIQYSGLLAFIASVLEVAIVITFIAVLASILRVDWDDFRSALSGGSGVEGAAVAQAPTGETEVTAPSAPAPSFLFPCPVSNHP